MKYYEMIWNNKVTGACTSDGLLHVVRESNCHTIVGEITKAQFDALGDSENSKPQSKKRFSADLVEKVKLTPL